METNQFIKATVGIVVVFLVIIAVAIPIIGGFTESSPGETGENTATTQLRNPAGGLLELNPGITITWSDGVTKVNDDVVTTDSTYITLFGFDYVQFGASTMFATMYHDSEASQIRELTASWDGSTLSVTTNNDSFTEQSTYAFLYYYPSQCTPSGDWISDKEYVPIYDDDASSPTDPQPEAFEDSGESVEVMG